MSHIESSLATTSIVFGITLSVIGTLKGPRVMIFNSASVYVDKTKLPTFFKFLLCVALLSMVIGYLFAKQLSMALQYTGINLLVSIIFGPSLILLRQHTHDKGQN